MFNLFDEPRHLARIKTKFLKFPSKGVTDLRERKLKKKKKQLKIREKKLKVRENIHVSYPMSKLVFFDVID